VLITHARIVRRAPHFDVVAVFVDNRRAGELTVPSGNGDSLRRLLHSRQFRGKPPEDPDA